MKKVKEFLRDNLSKIFLGLWVVVIGLVLYNINSAKENYSQYNSPSALGGEMYGKTINDNGDCVAKIAFYNADGSTSPVVGGWFVVPCDVDDGYIPVIIIPNMKEYYRRSIVNPASYSFDYCDGWEEGYCEGYKDVKGQMAICPVTPVCPVPKADCQSYNCGYNRAFKSGRKKAQQSKRPTKEFE